MDLGGQRPSIKTEPKIITFCDWLCKIKVTNICDSFFRKFFLLAKIVANLCTIHS